MKFKNTSHKDAYIKQLERCKIDPRDAERKALIYCLTLTEDCRNNFDSCYDKDNGLHGTVTLKFLEQGWPTSSDMRCIRLGFNLFNGGVPTAIDLEGDDKTSELKQNTPINIFCDSEYREYFYEAIRIRFEEV